MLARSNALFIVVAALALTPAASAQFDLSWNSIDGGAALSSGGAFVLEGTVGQADAGVLSGGAFILEGGFWNTALLPPKPGDADGDGDVDQDDIDIVLFHFGQSVPPGTNGDLDGDGDVDQDDIDLVLFNFGT